MKNNRTSNATTSTILTSAQSRAYRRQRQAELDAKRRQTYMWLAAMTLLLVLCFPYIMKHAITGFVRLLATMFSAAV